MNFTPEPNLYNKYGNPYRVAEFRVFSFNDCGAGCKNCFYLKSKNNYHDYRKVSQLAAELKANDYVLESCYILPTDVFENEFNYQLFDDTDFQQALSHFNFIGLATTLRNGFEAKVFDQLLSFNQGRLKIELHVNLREDLFTDENYLLQLEKSLVAIKNQYGNRILINLALNLGSKLSLSDHELLKQLVFRHSDDKILEMNFTFLFNPSMTKKQKMNLLKDSYPTMQYFTREYGKTEVEFTGRTLLRKPAFVFKNDKIFLTPIIPFDEFVFLDEKFCQLEEANFDSFLKTYQEIESRNLPILEECSVCENLPFCSGKNFFTVANELKLPCIKVAV